MQEFMSNMSLEEWFGLTGIIAVVLFALLTAFISHQTTLRVGRQKVAEARLLWADRYVKISLEIDYLIMSLNRSDSVGRPRTLFNDRQRMHARRLASELMYMINPESDGPASQDEHRAEVELLNRLATVGISLDMSNIRTHRSVLKQNWKRAKSEF